MKAIRVHEFGAPEVLVLKDVAEPVPGDGEVLVEVRAVGVNPVETYIRAGVYANKPTPPYTPGTDGAGVVVGVGPGVSGVKAGARVWLSPGPGSSGGTYASLVVCSATRAHPLPDRLSFAQGAALGVPYVTAWRALMIKGQAQAGDTVLVHGASGGVGIPTVQMARAAGLTIIGTAGSGAGRRLVREQGAHHVLDHTDATYRDQILEKTGGRGPDLIIEMLANVNLNHDLAMVARNGRVVIVGSRGNAEITPRNIMNKDSTLVGLTLWTTPDEDWPRIFAAVDAGLENGTLTPAIGSELPLADAAKAHVKVLESGAYGKMVLVP
jgi:NADPH2:quinone reductase